MEKIWLKMYESGVPAEINPDSYPSLVALFEEACEKFKGMPAVRNMGVTLNYGQLEEKSACFAAYLQNTLGLKKRGSARDHDAQSHAIFNCHVWGDACWLDSH